MDPNQQQPPVNEEPAPTSFDAPAESAPVEPTPAEFSPAPAVETEPASSPAPAADAQPAFSAPVSSTPAAADPGHGLGIASLVVSLIGFGLVGLILGIIGLKKSKSVGRGNGLAIGGIIIGIVNIIAVTLVFAVVAYGGVQLAAQCAELGNGVHTLDSGVTITCEV